MTNDRYACGGVVILSYLMLYMFEIFHDNFFKISGKKPSTVHKARTGRRNPYQCLCKGLKPIT